MTGIAALGNYRVLEEIGRGSMGIVYRGHDPFRDRLVALKVADRRRGKDARERRLFESLFFNETRAASLLHHPNIAQVYDAGAEDDYLYIAMEYIADATTLELFCRRENRLGLARVADIVFKCAEALDYAHRKGVIHRDVKPGNILVSGGTVKLVDFSVALLTDPRVVDTQLLVPVGSPLYMAPEQIREDPVTPATDLFALGVVLYELVTGEHPFIAETLAAVTRRVLDEDPPPVDSLRPDVPASLASIVSRAMAKEVPARYSSAFDLAADLSQIFEELERPRDGVKTEGRADALRKLSFFQRFDDAEVWELLRWARWEEFEPGERLITEGEESDSLYIIVTGSVSVSKEGRHVTTLGAGECVGEIAFLARQRRSATIVADTAVSAMSMNSELLENASDRCQVQFQRVFIETLIARLVQTTRSLVARSAAAASDETA